MADDQDQSQKTEDPTQRKLEDARKKGQVATSREVNHWFMILGGTLLVLMLAPPMMQDMALSLGNFLGNADLIDADSEGLRHSLMSILSSVAAAMAPAVGILVLFAIATGLVQNGVIFSAESIKPKLSKISPLAGVKRLFSLKAVMEFTKGILKLVIVGSVVSFLLWPELGRLERLPMFELVSTVALLDTLAGRVMVGALAVLTVIAGLDLLFQRAQHMKQMRMSRQELKDEFKQTEGDPMIKSRLRQIRMERARRRMMAAVPEADVVITNPTHYAVALRYVPAEMNAPVAVAKGVDSLALRIRETADEHEIPVIENPPLARALYATVPLDQEVPPEHYKAVAEIIGFVMGLRRTVDRGAAGPQGRTAPPGYGK